MDVELAAVRDFLAEHEPFSGLPDAVLDALPARMEARYYRRGSVLVEHGAANGYLFVLRSGSVDILDVQGGLVERAEVGESFGISSVMTGSPSNFRLEAHTDSLCLLLPAAFAGGEVTAAAPAISFYALCAADPAAWMAADAVLMIPFLRDIMRKWQ